MNSNYVFEPQSISAVTIVSSDKLFPVRRILCVGANYVAHQLEMGRDPSRELPFFFSKPRDSIVLADKNLNAKIPFPPQTNNLHYEIEMVVGIGKNTCNIEPSEAEQVVWGYGVGIDLTRRDLQKEAKDKGRPWELGKGFDNSAVISSLSPVSKVGHPSNSRIWLEVNTVIKQASRGADLYFVFRFLRLLTMDYKKTDAYKYKIIDAKGKPLRKSSELETTDEKASYTMLHRMVFKIRRLIEKVPIVGKSILLNYAAALFLLKEQNNPRVWTDENYATRKLNEFLENEDWVESAKILREEVEQMSRLKFGEYLTEDGHTDVASAKNQVKIAMDALQKMNTELSKLPDDGSLPTWWTNKVAIAVDKLDGMADYLDTQVEEVMMDLIQSLEERKMTDAEMDKREKIVLSL